MSYLAYCPTGTLFDFAGTTSPNGWMVCDGRSLSTTTYANLFAVIGYNYGGSGASFNIPDFRGKFARSMDNMGTGAANIDTGRVVGTTQTDATAVNGLENASSSISGTIDGGSHNHSLTLTNNWGGSSGGTPGWCVDNGSPIGSTTQTTTSTAHTHNHSLTAAAQSLSGDTETRPINLSCYKIIKL